MAASNSNCSPTQNKTKKKNKFDHVYLNKTRVIKTRRLQFKGVYVTLRIHFILTRER